MERRNRRRWKDTSRRSDSRGRWPSRSASPASAGRAPGNRSTKRPGSCFSASESSPGRRSRGAKIAPSAPLDRAASERERRRSARRFRDSGECVRFFSSFGAGRNLAGGGRRFSSNCSSASRRNAFSADTAQKAFASASSGIPHFIGRAAGLLQLGLMHEIRPEASRRGNGLPGDGRCVRAARQSAGGLPTRSIISAATGVARCSSSQLSWAAPSERPKPVGPARLRARLRTAHLFPGGP